MHLFLVALLALTAAAPVTAHGPERRAGGAPAAQARELTVYPEVGNFVLEVDGREIVCRGASPAESAAILDRSAAGQLHIINANRKREGGMTILLRATDQLNRFPQAKQAFIEAAAKWESRINTPITVVLDVDYGPTRFGQPYPSGVLGSTRVQAVLRSGNYADVRAALVARASNREEAGIFNALPPDTLATDIGTTSSVYLPTPVMRALGLLQPVADPDNEQGIGSTPSIGFNSNFPFDFDPDNGVDGDKFDFDATAVHEIGHALGFVSTVGYQDISLFPVAPSIWDLFRLRPGATLDTFGSAERILSAGGEQHFFTGAGVPLSTGRPDHTGGDQQQASHWKSRYLGARRYYGIMDPTGNFGDRDTISANDTLALDFFGYSLAGGTAPAIGEVTAALDGDVLTVTGSGTDGEGNAIMARAVFYDAAGELVAEAAPVAIDSGFAEAFEFLAAFEGLGDLPSATQADVILIDGNANESVAARVDFGQADEGAPTLATVTFNTNKSRLKIKGGDLGGAVQLEINGVVVPDTVTLKPNRRGTALKATGGADILGLRSGPNRIRVLRGELRSNIFVLNF
jgi:hypothetical protein